MAATRNIASEHADLAVRDASCRARVLPCDALPCFRKPVSSMTSTALSSANVSSA
jgi:hypothetical protein